MSPAFSIAALLLSLTATAAAAQPAAPANFNLPHAYAGYSQPEITQCTNVGALTASCVVPAMTAGRYVIVAQGSATSTGANATQGLSISVNGQPCIALKPTPFTGKKALPPLFCRVTFLTDAPLTITATYSVENATPDAAGPHMVVRRAPWNGVVESNGGVLPPRPAPAKK